MTIASDLLQRHVQTLVEDNVQWQALIADDLVWELAPPSIGHPARLSGREEVVRHVTWFLGAVENFRFFDSGYIPPPIRKRQSPKSRRRRVSRLRGVPIARRMCSSCVPKAARSRTFASISIQFARPRRWIRRFLVSNLKYKRRRAG